MMQFMLVMQFTLGAKRLSVSGSTALASIYSSAVFTGDPDARFAIVRM